MSLSSHLDIPLPGTLKTLIACAFEDTVVKQLPLSQLELGDRKLERAREISDEFASVISQNDRNLIEERITFAREIRVGIDSKSGFSRFRHAREYFKAATGANHFAENISDSIRMVARSLYRCHLSCNNAFPSSCEKEEWIATAWREACEWKGVSLCPLPKGEGADSSIKLLIDMKIKVMHAVESSYGFSTSRVPDSISHNTRLAQVLLTNMTFIFREIDIDGTPHHPYRHSIIQKVVNMTWFQDKDGDGVLFPKYFTPIPIQAIALALTVIECCIDEWTDGTRKASNWNEGRYKAIYHSHISSLNELSDHPQGGGLLTQIQYDLLKDAR